jgi:hypothetical protein
MRGTTFAQQSAIAQMKALGASPLATEDRNEYGDVLVLVTRGDGMTEVKAVESDGHVRSITHPHEDRRAVTT